MSIWICWVRCDQVETCWSYAKPQTNIRHTEQYVYKLYLPGPPESFSNAKCHTFFCVSSFFWFVHSTAIHLNRFHAHTVHILLALRKWTSGGRFAWMWNSHYFRCITINNRWRVLAFVTFHFRHHSIPFTILSAIIWQTKKKMVFLIYTHISSALSYKYFHFSSPQLIVYVDRSYALLEAGTRASRKKTTTESCMVRQEFISGSGYLSVYRLTWNERARARSRSRSQKNWIKIYKSLVYYSVVVD